MSGGAARVRSDVLARFAGDESLLCGWGWSGEFALERAKELFVSGVWDFRKFEAAVGEILRHVGPDGIIRWSR